VTQECNAEIILSRASWYCRMYSNVIGDGPGADELHKGCNPQFHVWAVFMTPETAVKYRKCDVCGRVGPHMAHASTGDSQRPADPPFDRTLADDMADKRTL
jgi:hypothetical protein